MDDFNRGVIANINIDNFEFTSLTVTEARSVLDGDALSEDFFHKLDQAQSKVFSGDHQTTLLIMVITSDAA